MNMTRDPEEFAKAVHAALFPGVDTEGGCPTSWESTGSALQVIGEFEAAAVAYDLSAGCTIGHGRRQRADASARECLREAAIIRARFATSEGR